MAALPDKTANTLTNFLINEFIANHGVPDAIRCDSGKEFEKPFSTVCKNLNIKLFYGTPGYPQSNG